MSRVQGLIRVSDFLAFKLWGLRGHGFGIREGEGQEDRHCDKRVFGVTGQLPQPRSGLCS